MTGRPRSRAIAVATSPTRAKACAVSSAGRMPSVRGDKDLATYLERDDVTAG